MRLFPALLCGLALYALAAPAAHAQHARSAANEDDYSRTGFYVGIAGIAGFYTESERALNDELSALGYTSGSDGFDEGFGGEISIGYRTSEYIAVEAQVEYLAPSTIEIGGVDVGEVDALTATIATKLYPIRGRIQPYGVLGAGMLRVDFEDNLGMGVSGDETSLVLRAGAGVDYYLTRSFALNAGIEYMLPIGSLDNLDLLNFSVGAVFRF